MTAARLVLVRHGESEWNRDGRWQGHGGGSLTERGRRQAEAVAEALAHRHPDARLLARSDLERVEQTAAPIVRLLDLPVLVDERLRELDVGTWSGRTHEEVRRADPDGFAAWGRAEDLAIGGGESRADLRRRVAEALGELLAVLAGGDTAVVVTHGGVVRAAGAELLGLGATTWEELGPVGNATITEFACTPGGARLVAWAAADHLDESLRSDARSSVTSPR